MTGCYESVNGGEGKTTDKDTKVKQKFPAEYQQTESRSKVKNNTMMVKYVELVIQY